jgi:S1-C subfamily serine protease
MPKVCKRLIFAAATFLALAGSSRSDTEPTIYLIVVGDTLDPKIGRSVAFDIRTISAGFGDQARLGERLKIETIEGENCRPDSILRRVASLTPGADDAVVVYYSGHGAFDDQIDQYFKFPRLGSQTILTRAQVRDAIKAKGTRLGVLITDCCNSQSVVPRVPRPVPMAAPMYVGPPPISPLFISLFIETRGFVDVTSSKKGERSIAYPATRLVGRDLLESAGGVFTTALERVFSEGKMQSLDWQTIVSKTADRVRIEFQRLKPDGLDNEEEPENPQLTQTVFARDLGLKETTRVVEKDDRDSRPEPFVPSFSSNESLGVLGYENGGQGIVVWASRPGSAAARMGLEHGDQIFRVNDTTVRSARGFSQLIDNAMGAVELTFRDVRTGQIRSANVELDGGAGFALPPDEREDLGIDVEPAEGKGVRVASIVRGSPAGLLGLDPGDIIADINGKPVRTVAQYRQAIRQSGRELWLTVLDVRTGKYLGTVVQRDLIEPGHANFTLGIHACEGQGGLYIWAPRPGGPAARLGLERGDVILSVDGSPTGTVTAYRSAIQASTGIVTLTFRDVRTGQIKSDKITLDRPVRSRRPAEDKPSLGVAAIGMPGQGVKVAAVSPNSPAAILQLDPGDVITHINGQFIDSVDDFRTAIASSDDEMIFTLINVRTGQPLGEVVQLDR